MRSLLLTLPVMLGLSACSISPSSEGSDGPEGGERIERVASDTGADSMRSNDPRPDEEAQVGIPDPEERPTMQLQVVLDRLGFTPGVVDGKMGMSTENAISGFQEASDLEVTGKLNAKTKEAMAKWDNIPATRVVTIPTEFAQEQFQKIPESPAEKAKLERLGYTSLDEKLAERFHTTVEVLKMLNPGGVPAGMEKTDVRASPIPSGTPARLAKASPRPSPSGSPAAAGGTNGSAKTADASFFKAGQKIRVPNVGADRIAAGSVEDADWLSTLRTLGVGSDQPDAARIVVSQSEGTLKVFNEQDELIGMYTATMGSEHDPLPLGNWKVLAVAHNPPFSFNPELFWDVADSEAKQTLPPGPNGPVGVVWIDLSKEHYGIHGTPEPQTIGRVQSHGCVRLTNWDAARLAQMVSPSTKVVFEA